MALLSFPFPAVNGQLYPVTPAAGQNQYMWEQATLTWRLVGTATTVTAGIYGDADNIPQITVDVTGKITLASNIPIGQYYVKTNNPGAFNGYLWPNSDGLANTFLTTDGAGQLSWVSNPFINYWQLVGGTTLFPTANGYNLALTDGAGNITFFADDTGTLELSGGNPGDSFLQFNPDNTASTISAASSATTAEPIVVRGQDVTLAAYGNSFLNAPSQVLLTQSEFSSTVNISTTGGVIVNSGTANSFATPTTRGSSGQFLVSNGDGTTAWTTNPIVNYWQRVGTILTPITAGDSVEIRDSSSIPRILLAPDGTITMTYGLQNLVLDPDAALGVTQIKSTANLGVPGTLKLTGDDIVLESLGGAFANAPTTLTVGYPGSLELVADIAGVPTPLFTVNSDGDLSTGRYINNLAPALFADGLNGNVTVGGRLTVNAGVPAPGSANSYTFPGNRGVLDYALFTNADGTTRWDSVNAVTGYWAQNGIATELYPNTLGQNVLLRDGAGVTTITLDADGYITCLGGDANAPTYGFAGNKTGFYGGTTDQINIGVNGVKVAKFDDNFFYCYEDINFVGASTNPGADAILENTNSELLFSASTSPTVSKSIVFENSQNNEVGRFNTTDDFIVSQGNAAIGSTVVNTTINSITLSIGANAANKAGRLKLYSLYNGGDGFELFQDETTGTVTLALNSAAVPTIQFDATDVTVTANQEVTGNLQVDQDFFLPTPTVPPLSTSAGTPGQIAWDANYVYICIAANTWKRSPLTTW